MVNTTRGNFVDGAVQIMAMPNSTRTAKIVTLNRVVTVIRDTFFSTAFGNMTTRREISCMAYPKRVNI